MREREDRVQRRFLITLMVRKLGSEVNPVAQNEASVGSEYSES